MNRSDDREAVRCLIEEWAAAVRHGDIAAIVRHHTSDMVMFDVPEPVRVDGLTAYTETWQLFFQHNVPGADVFCLEDLVITATPNIAFAHGLIRIGIGEPRCRLTLGLKKIGDQWWISHEHHSMPLGPERFGLS